MDSLFDRSRKALERAMGPTRKAAPSKGAQRSGKKSSAKKALPPAEDVLSLAVPMEASPLDITVPDPMALQPRLAPGALPGISSRGARPGDYRGSGLELSQGLKSGKSEKLFMNPEEYNALVATAMGTQPSLDIQRGISDQEALYKSFLENAPKTVDLTPLMAWADSLTGSKYAQSYKAPPGYEEQAAILSGMQGKTQSARERLAQLIAQETGGLRKGEQEQGYSAQLGEEQKAGYQVPRPPSTMLGGNPFTQATGALRSFQALPTYKDAQQQLASAISMKELLAHPSWSSDFSIRGQTLQAMRLSPISEKEMAEFGRANPSLANRVRTLFSEKITGRSLSERDYYDLKKFADFREQYSSSRMRDIQQEFVTGFSPYTPAISKEGLEGITESAIPKPMKTSSTPESRGAQILKELMKD